LVVEMVVVGLLVAVMVERVVGVVLAEVVRVVVDVGEVVRAGVVAAPGVHWA
jgi:hypothetical protein